MVHASLEISSGDAAGFESDVIGTMFDVVEDAVRWAHERFDVARDAAKEGCPVLVGETRDALVSAHLGDGAEFAMHAGAEGADYKMKLNRGEIRHWDDAAHLDRWERVGKSPSQRRIHQDPSHMDHDVCKLKCADTGYPMDYNPNAIVGFVEHGLIAAFQGQTSYAMMVALEASIDSAFRRFENA